MEAYYRNLLQEQMQKKKAAPIQEVEKGQNGPSSEDDESSQQQQAGAQGDRFKPADKETPSATYSRKNLLTQTLKEASTTKLPSMKKELSEEDKDLIRRLQARDAEVRSHEMRHVAALGPYAGSMHFDYQVGPDGRAYAIGGTTEVRNTGSSDPKASAQRARIIRQAAMAGGDPSHADMSVAASATQTEQSSMAKQS
ncbi:MAG: hypothetical protein A2X46_13795 [Lentisphaerae bacterium GWF2_57_35]|nr:MAG: hypothetical protein A2X46_13795 [Lentisphaerae bacterium GWF2_57_35]